MAEQETKMVIKVDLQCRRCYKKIKKILCEIPQVKDRIFDEKQNTVTITVVCCSPEKVRQKICCKGGCCILGIDIILPKPDTKNQSTQTKEPDTQDKSTQTKEPDTQDKSTQTGPAGKLCSPPPVLGYPPVYVMGPVYVCPPCHNRGCSWFCPCNCHCRRPPICDGGCGRPPMCRDGCGWLAHECRCQRPLYSRCCD
ncbi:protein PYRICULARIA ORYZAE RESISTANCE 21-like [Rhodamnia argentea]|uniref:Protein PYRICULARIA ORYZAE RESISTANCE 21-like n=1 Tax=Rhodamnia argentea TaxID=178133 RepID=A0ABM3H6P5_9MYRT|nr:protein PYRICULARIA ORYZAE RESISTANCE 21-like [Rhodamnia argentea]